MASYSVADAKNNLPKLINRVLEGEQVIITRHGKPVVELRSASAPPQGDRRAFHQWFISRRRARPPVEIDSVALINEMREADIDRVLGHKRSGPDSD